jgi:hypothetical protein
MKRRENQVRRALFRFGNPWKNYNQDRKFFIGGSWMKRILTVAFISLMLVLPMLYCDTKKSNDKDDVLLLLLLSSNECLVGGGTSCWKGLSVNACNALLGTLEPAFYCQINGYTTCIGGTVGQESGFVCIK